SPSFAGPVPRCRRNCAPRRANLRICATPELPARTQRAHAIPEADRTRARAAVARAGNAIAVRGRERDRGNPARIRPVRRSGGYAAIRAAEPDPDRNVAADTTDANHRQDAGPLPQRTSRAPLPNPTPR